MEFSDDVICDVMRTCDVKRSRGFPIINKNETTRNLRYENNNSIMNYDAHTTDILRTVDFSFESTRCIQPLASVSFGISCIEPRISS
jgi:hypothetical protein